jgi:RNA polymerase sigma factor for flagellar operon FliA
MKYNPSLEGDVERCVVHFAPLVKRMAHHMMASLPPNVMFDDVVQSGMLGLLDAARRYQEAQGAQFETYATQRIRGAMLDGLRQSDCCRGDCAAACAASRP